MPTIESIPNSVLPREVEKPIPVRTVSTRVGARPQPIINQTHNNVEPVGAESPATADSVRLSPQVSALARKEQAYRQRVQAIEAREKAVEAKLADADKYSQLKTKIGSKDFSAAEELGLTYEEYVQYKLNQTNSDDPTAQALKKLESEIESLKKGKEENAAQEYEETVAEYKTEIKKLIETSEDYPMAKKAKAEAAVLQLFLDTWDQEQDPEYTIDKAAKDVEEHLKSEAKKWASLIEEQAPSEVESAAAPPPPKLGKTLTQTMASSNTSSVPKKSLQHLSEAERYAEARRRVLEKQQKGIF